MQTPLPSENSLATYGQGHGYYNKLFSPKIKYTQMSPGSAPQQIATHLSIPLSYLPLRLLSVEHQEENIYPGSASPSWLTFPSVSLFGSWPIFSFMECLLENFLDSTRPVVSQARPTDIWGGPQDPTCLGKEVWAFLNWKKKKNQCFN